MKIKTQYIHLPSLVPLFRLFHLKIVSQEWQNMCVPSPPHNPKGNDTKAGDGAGVIWKRFLRGTSY